MTVDLRVNLGGLEMANPVTDASGTFAAGREYADLVDVSRLGAVTTKGVSLDGWEGNPAPRIAKRNVATQQVCLWHGYAHCLRFYHQLIQLPKLRT